MTAAEPLRSVRGRRTLDMAGAVQRLDVVAINADLARLVVFWLGRYAELAAQRNGCIPDGLVEAQHALAEAAVSVGDSRQREQNSSAAVETIVSGHEPCVDTATAAAALGCTADKVRDHCRRGNLKSRKVGRQHMVTVDSLESLRVRLNERNGE